MDKNKRLQQLEEEWARLDALALQDDELILNGAITKAEAIRRSRQYAARRQEIETEANKLRGIE